MFFERPAAGTQVLLVHIKQDDSTVVELKELAISAGLVAVAEVAAKRLVPNPKTYLGQGKVAEIAALARETDAQLILLSEDLSPSQERNLESLIATRVLGRTGLILNIFAQRARTHEGQLQVELAQLQHATTRLVRGWTHLDRQKGGSGRGQGAAIGVTGAGETQLEVDQRMLRSRIKNIKQRLIRVRKQRHQNRRARHKADIKTVSLVGYTNTGKSTLFNQLCAAKVHAADQLFATLDPTLRQITVDLVGKVIISDTVGFIRQLPHDLVDAFQATLEEVRQADLLLHVVDAAAADQAEQIQQVNAVLADIGASDVPQLMIYNKIDLINQSPREDLDAEGRPFKLWISALHNAGLPQIRRALGRLLCRDMLDTTLRLAPDQGRLRGKLFAAGAVVSENYETDGTICLHIRMEVHYLRRIFNQCSLPADGYLLWQESSVYQGNQKVL